MLDKIKTVILPISRFQDKNLHTIYFIIAEKLLNVNKGEVKI